MLLVIHIFHVSLYSMFHEQLEIIYQITNIHFLNILSVSNGGCPVNRVTIRIPNDHTSVAKLCGVRLAISLQRIKKMIFFR
jgi:hypothetical protein